MPVTRSDVRAIGAAVLVGLLLTGCSASMSPGDAAVVSGTPISMDRADETAEVYCRVSLLSRAQAGAGASIDNAEVRRQAVSELVSGAVARMVAEREGIHVPPSAYVFTREQRSQVGRALPDADVDQVVRVLEDGQRTYAIAERLGEAATGQQVTQQNAAQVQEAGRAVLADALKQADVTIDPRFGLGRDGRQVATTGSLSARATATAPDRPATVPATQRCS